MRNSPEVSVIIPMIEVCEDFASLNADYLRELDKLDEAFELIYVVDVSNEAMAAEVSRTVAECEFAKSITLSHEFGDSTALKSGVQAAAGERILVLPERYQTDPADILKVLGALDHCDMAVGERDRRDESSLNRLQGGVFNRLISWVTATGVTDMGSDLRAFTRQVAEEVSFYGDQHRFLPVLAYRMGFDVKGVSVRQSAHNRAPRLRGPGAYTRSLLDILNVVFLTRFTKKPLRFFGLIGLTLTALGAMVVLYVVGERLFFDVQLATRPALVVGALMLVVGLQITAIGLIGEIVIFSRARDLPEYYVKEVVEHPGPGASVAPIASDKIGPASGGLTEDTPSTSGGTG